MTIRSMSAFFSNSAAPHGLSEVRWICASASPARVPTRVMAERKHSQDSVRVLQRVEHKGISRRLPEHGTADADLRDSIPSHPI